MNGDVYTLGQVERLLGLHESYGHGGDPELTILDLMSWASDPGGDRSWRWLNRFEVDDWRWRRGPIAPDGPLACVLYDFERAVSHLTVLEHAVVSLTICGFSERDIAEVLHDARRGTQVSRNRVHAILNGRPQRGPDGSPVRDGNGDTIEVGGAKRKILGSMNGERRTRAVRSWHAETQEAVASAGSSSALSGAAP